MQWSSTAAPPTPPTSRRAPTRSSGCIEAAGGKAAVFRADISSAQERRSLVEFLDREFARLDLLVNNAGIEPEPLDMLEGTEERLERVLAVNLKGPYFLTQALARRMIGFREQGLVPAFRGSSSSPRCRPTWPIPPGRSTASARRRCTWP